LAQYKHLPIYKLTYDLLNEVTKHTRHYPKDFKYTLGTKVRDETVETKEGGSIKMSGNAKIQMSGGAIKFG
jgi:hypothetical protein